MSVELGACLGLVAATLVIGVYYVIDVRLRRRRRKAAKDALDNADIGSAASVGEFVYQALAKTATADYESDPDIRLAVAQVLDQARRARP